MIIIRSRECELENKKQHPGACMCAGFFNGLPFGGETVVGFESTCAKTTKKKQSFYCIWQTDRNRRQTRPDLGTKTAEEKMPMHVIYTRRRQPSSAHECS